MTIVTLTVGTEWVVPTNVRSIKVTLLGGGGGGCGGVRIFGFPITYYGGLGGRCAIPGGPVWVYTTPGSTITYVIGAGGQGGQGSFQWYPTYYMGANGGNTSFTGAGIVAGGLGATSIAGSTITLGQPGESTDFPGISASPGSPGGAGGSGYGAGGGGGNGNCGDFGCSGGRGSQGLIIIEYGITPVATFNIVSYTNGGKAPSDVQFADTSTGGAVAWEWDFGDGSAHSTLQNPVHTYTIGGIYSACLRVTGGYGDVSGWYCRSFTIGGDAPIASFTGTPVAGSAPLTVQFTDASTGATGWAWTFGDGGTSTSPNPTHTYTTTGTFTVALTVTNFMGSNTQTRTSYISVTSQPIAAFVIRNKEVFQLAPFCPDGCRIKLYDKSTCYASKPASWAWTISAYGKTPITSTDQNPEITLPVSSGSSPVYWSVSLAITDTLGSTSATSTISNAIVQRLP